MKVLHLVKTSLGATWAMREMRELVKLGVEVHVAMPVDGPLVPKYKEYGITIHPIEYSLKHIGQTISNLRKIVKDVNPDIIQSHFVLTTLIMRLALRNDKRPRIFQVPGPLHLENSFFRNLEIKSSQTNDYWIGTCNWTCKRYLKSGVKPDRVFKTFYGTDITDNKSNVSGAIRNEYNLPQNAAIFGMVAFMYAPKHYLGQKRGLKGHEDFIDAIAIVNKKYPNVYGVCVGGAWDNAIKYERQIKDYAKSSGANIIFMGTRNNVPDLYNDMFAVVHPSHSENLGGASESLLLQVPTIATTVGGFPDIVIDGETGLLVPPKEPKILAQRMMEMIEGKYDIESFKSRGYELVKQSLSVVNTAKDVYDIYQKILSR